jgi:hypothetical protein
MDDAATLIKDDGFIADCARYSEGILDEKFLRKKYRLAEETWTRLGADDQLVEAIELERLRRIRNGSSKRELAQKHIVAAPNVLNTIMSDERASPRHRVDAIKTLDVMSATNPEAAPVEDRFQITINLSADEKIVINKPYAKTIDPDPNTTFRKAIKPNPHDIDAEIVDHDNDDTQGSFCFAAIAARRDGNEGGGAPR